MLDRGGLSQSHTQIDTLPPFLSLFPPPSAVLSSFGADRQVFGWLCRVISLADI